MAHLLSEYAGTSGYVVVRDGRFSHTGKLSTPLENLCVPLRSREWMKHLVAHPSVAAVITAPELAEEIDGALAVGIAAQPHDAHYTLHAAITASAEARLRATPTVIHPSARIDPLAHVAPYGVQIGPDVTVEPFARIYPSAVIEEGCVIRGGASVGIDGFAGGVISGRYGILPQVGGVRLKPHVHLMPNVCVSRAVFGGETVIGEETIIDTHGYVAHDCTIGRRVVICAMANLMGRVTVGDGAHIGPSAVVRNGVRIGDLASVSMGAVVTRDVEPGQRVTGNFAVPHEQFLGALRVRTGS